MHFMITGRFVITIKWRRMWQKLRGVPVKTENAEWELYIYDYRNLHPSGADGSKRWMLKRIGLFWEYERIEPARLHFAVSHCRG